MPLSSDDVSHMTPSAQWSLSPIEQAGRHAHVKSRSAFDEGDTVSVMPEADNISKPLPSFRS